MKKINRTIETQILDRLAWMWKWKYADYPEGEPIGGEEETRRALTGRGYADCMFDVADLFDRYGDEDE